MALPAWMLDASICARMVLSAPLVLAKALRDLHRLLQERGFRRSSCGDSPVAVSDETEDERAAKDAQESAAAAPVASDPQRVETAHLRGLTSAERKSISAPIARWHWR